MGDTELLLELKRRGGGGTELLLELKRRGGGGYRAPVGAKKKRRWGRGSSEGSKKFLLGFVRRRGWEWQKSNGEGFSSGQ